MTASPSPALSLTDLSKEFGGLRAVDGVSLAVASGERRAIIGPNGAGKTTLFSLISGETRAADGRITLFGRDVTRLAPHRRAALGLARTYQITNLFPRLTALENCLLAVQALTSAKFHLHRPLSRYPAFHDRARAVLEAVGLGDKAEEAVRNLSHGEQRQLEIARALMTNPELLLMDEPTEGLAPLLVREVGRVIESLKAQGLSILLVEQNLPLALRVADHVHVLSRGRVVHSSAPDALWRNEEIKSRYLGL